MSVKDDQRIPVVVKMDGIESLKLEPEEVFVFSRVNGQSTLHEIAQILGYDTARVTKLLNRLREAGLLRYDEPKAMGVPKKSHTRGPSILDQLDEDESNWDLKRLPRERRKEILLRFDVLSRSSYYEIFGVDSVASPAEIKRKYFQLVKEIHPDRFFGQNIGHYQEKLEKIFGTVTKAYETLNDPVQRNSYDRELAEKTKAAKKGTGEKNTEEEGPKSASRGKTLIERLATAKHYHEMGRKEEAEGRQVQAAMFYQLACQFDPSNSVYERSWSRLMPVVARQKSDQLHKQAVEALAKGDTSSATVLLEEALELNPRKKECYRDLAMLYGNRKATMNRARELGMKAVDFYPNDSNVHLVMGKIYRDLGEEALARKEFTVAIRLDKGNAAAERALKDLEGK